MHNAIDFDAARVEMWRMVEEIAEDMIVTGQTGPVRIPLTLARWVVNAESITPADLERAREGIRRPEVQAELARLRADVQHCTICGQPLNGLHGMCGGTPSYDSAGRPLGGPNA